MRFQLNKLGNIDHKTLREEFFKKVPKVNCPEHTIKKISDEARKRRSVNIHERDKSVFFICPNCGAELYGEWKYLDIYNKLEKVARGGYRADIFDDDVQQCEYVNGYWNYYTTGCYSQAFYNKIEALIKEHEKNNKDVLKEIDKVCNTKRCLICNAELSNDEAYYTNKLYDFKINAMHKEIADFSKSKANENVFSFIQNVDIKPHTHNCLNNQIETNTLKEYVLNIINLESNIMCLSKRLEQLYFQQIYNNKDVVFEHNYALYDLRQDIESKSSRLKNSKKELSDFENQPINFKKKEYPSKPEYPNLRTPYFFNKKKVEAENAQTLRDYEIAIDKYNSDIKQCDADNEKLRIAAEGQRSEQVKQLSDKIGRYASELIESQNKLGSKLSNINSIPTKALGEKHLLDSEIKTVEDTLKELFKCRNELYSYNIVFDKYRNIVALSTFYEYLMSGRCETLEGINGAYNIYENEIRLNTIITKLDEIKENQFMIYNKLRDIDNSLSTLNSTMEKAVSSLDTINKNTTDMNVYLHNISKNTAVIAHNSAVTAYYSKVNAELTNALGFMVALK